LSKTTIIINPAAGRDRAGRLLNDIQSAFAAALPLTLVETRVSGEEERLTRQAIESGSTTIVAVGGDGTCSKIAGEILKSGRACRLAVIPTGTGNDFAKTIGVAGYAPRQVADLLLRETPARIDVGLADGRYFVNSCGFGFDPSVLEATQKVRFLKGDAVYVYAALRQLFSYRGIDVSANGVAGVESGRMLMVTISNGRSLGGAFKIAPHASVLDGKLDACFFSDSNVVERAKLFVGALRGTHLGMRAVSSASVEQLTLRFARRPSMEVDGELRIARSTTVELKCVPRALSVVAAPGALV
jgi:YegS/Rv2252/BmrU family lipid kinase